MTENEQARGLESQIRQIAEDAARKVVKEEMGRTRPNDGDRITSLDEFRTEIEITAKMLDSMVCSYSERRTRAEFLRIAIRRYRPEASPAAVVTAEDVRAAYDAYRAPTGQQTLWDFTATFLTARLAERIEDGRLFCVTLRLDDTARHQVGSP